MNILIWSIVVLILLGVLLHFLPRIPMDDSFRSVVRIIIIIAAVLVVIWLIFALIGGGPVLVR